MNLRFAEVKYNADGNMGDWLFTASEYTEWEKPSPSSEFLTLKGKPGSGKSVLMKRAVQRALAVHTDGWTIPIYFFFDHDSGNRDNPLNASAQGLYRCLLSQLVRAKVLPHEFIAKYARRKNDLRSCIGLENALQEALEHCKTLKRQIVIFVDAMDECTTDLDNGIGRVLNCFVQTQSSNLGVKFLLSSSYKLNHSVYCPDTILLSIEDGNQPDLSKYIDEELKTISSPAISLELRQYLSLQMREQASGSFLWTRLVLHEIKHSWSNYPGKRILEILEKIPKDLTELYQRLLEPSGLSNGQHTLSLLQLILFAEQPLSLSEVRQALAVEGTTGSSSREYQKVLEGLPQGPLLEDYVRSISRGLAEFTSRPRQPYENHIDVQTKKSDDTTYIQLIHRTAHTHLLEGGALAALEKTEQSEVTQRGHLCMLRITLKALDWDNMKEDHVPPLRRYAGAYWMKHAGACDKLLESFKLPSFVTSCSPKTSKVVALYKQYLDSGDSEYSCDLEDEESLFVFLAVSGCTTPIAQHHRRCKRDQCSVGAGSLPAPEQADELAEIMSVWDRALYFASVADHHSTVRYLEEHGKDRCDPNRGLERSTALYMACYKGNVDIVKDLLEWGADALQVCEQPYQTALHAAVACGHLEVVEVLFDGCDGEQLLELRDSSGCTALHVAVHSERDDVVKLLLEKIADTGDDERFYALQSSEGHTALQIAQARKAQNVLDVFADFVEVDE